jgi:hypothetical protein
MVKKAIEAKIQAFTIFEITVVIALMGVLVTIISVSLNRFNEQLKLNSELQGELNYWMMARANLWTEYYNADSLAFDGKVVTVFQKERTLYLKEEDDFLYRKENNQDWKSMNIPLDRIEENGEKEKQFIRFTFPLKNELMELDYYKRPNKRVIVNNYFDRLNE